MDYSVLKKTREGCRPNAECELICKVKEYDLANVVEVYHGEKGKLLYCLDLPVTVKKQLLCLIADSIPEPVKFLELESLGFVKT